MMVYLNGHFLPLADARVSVMDRGFLFGDGVYEVIPVYSRKPFRLAEHLRRLFASLAAIALPNPHREDEWLALITRIIAESESDDQSLYIQITRGPMALRNHVFPAQTEPSVFIMAEPLLPPLTSQREEGVAAVSAEDFRWLRCDIKSTSLLANCLLRQIAVNAGCAETLLMRDGYLTEGSATNIFVIKNNHLLAPPKNHLMLAGITYDVILEIAVAHGLTHEVRAISAAEVRAADELWMTSSTREVLPIVTLDNQPIGAGKPGPMFARMYEWYQAFKREIMRNG